MGRMRVRHEEVERLLADPPRGTRAARTHEASASVLQVVADLDERVRKLGEQVDDLRNAVARADPGEALPTAAGSLSQTLTEVRRRLQGARDAVAELTAVGALYEEALEEQEQAAALEREAAVHRARGARALRDLVTSYRVALSVASAAVDLDDLAGR
jgi:hypothetical protein